MKTLLVASLHLALLLPMHAALTVPGANGTDGVLNITANTEIDLSLAPTAAWDSDNTANAGKGVYDPAKWAVVFKYSSVTVATGATLTFKNHPSRAPLVWLVSGNVTINGSVKVDGQSVFTNTASRLAEPGPGGFRGGASFFGSSVTEGSGFGFGGAPRGYNLAASYGTQGNGSPIPYGNPSLVPLIGGSGGGGTAWSNSPGGAGGGAMLIAAVQTVQINGSVTANGGNAKRVNDNFPTADSSAGSGGGIRLVCDSLTGTGQITATGGNATGLYTSGNGRIRLERVVNTNTIAVVPAPSVVDLAVDATSLIWPPVGAPEVRIVSLGGVSAPADPRSAFGTTGADVALPTATSTEAIIETTNVEQASQVKVRITPRDSTNFTEISANYSSTVSTTPLVLRWTAGLPTTLGYSAVQVKVIRP